MRLLLTLLVFSIFVSDKAQASDPMWFTCAFDQTTPADDGMTWPNFKLGTLADFDGRSYLLLQGILNVPDPAYSYQFIETAKDRATLQLKRSDGMSIAVISKLNIQERFEQKKMRITRYVVDIEKPFNWGPSRIICDLR